MLSIPTILDLDAEIEFTPSNFVITSPDRMEYTLPLVKHYDEHLFVIDVPITEIQENTPVEATITTTEKCFMVTKITKLPSRSHFWEVNSGATSHMTNTKKFYYNISKNLPEK